MKKSEQLHLDAQSADNDYESLRLHTKALREKRAETFEDRWLQVLLEKVNVTYDDKTGKYTMKHKRLGTLDFYPKKNRILIRAENKWYNRGLQWLIKNFELK
ncbi:MAG: hypothetical protein JJE45_00360 [Prolixibacteraceae bacterium]|nr:hypothetical protein [Prolixibacteraceae bacterium]